MMTWRMIQNPTRRMLVWILPNGWIVDTSGFVWPWRPHLDVDVEDPEGGFESDEDAMRISLQRRGAFDTVEFTTSWIPHKTGLPFISKNTEGDMVLIGSAEYAGVPEGYDVRLFREDGGTAWRSAFTPDDGSPRGFILTQPLGTMKSGEIHPLTIDFQASRYPGFTNDPYTKAFNIVA